MRRDVTRRDDRRWACVFAFNILRSSRDKFSIGVGRTRSVRARCAGAQSEWVETNLETAMYNDRARRRRKFGAERPRPAHLRLTSVSPNASTLPAPRRLARQFNSASICHLTYWPPRQFASSILHPPFSLLPPPVQHLRSVFKWINSSISSVTIYIAVYYTAIL